MKIYVNWDTHDIKTESEFEDELNEKIEDIKNDFDDGNIPDSFWNWLEGNYTVTDIFEKCCDLVRTEDVIEDLKNSFFDDLEDDYNENDDYLISKAVRNIKADEGTV